MGVNSIIYPAPNWSTQIRELKEKLALQEEQSAKAATDIAKLKDDVNAMKEIKNG